MALSGGGDRRPLSGVIDEYYRAGRHLSRRSRTVGADLAAPGPVAAVGLTLSQAEAAGAVQRYQQGFVGHPLYADRARAMCLASTCACRLAKHPSDHVSVSYSCPHCKWAFAPVPPRPRSRTDAAGRAAYGSATSGLPNGWRRQRPD